VLVASALSLSACGEEADPTIEATDLVPSRTDYIIDADTICFQYETGIRTSAELSLGIGANDFRLTRAGEIVFKPGREPSPGALRRFGEGELVPALREQLAELRALTPPAGDEARLAAIYETAEDGVDELARNPDLAGDRVAVRVALNRARRAARRYGFATCGTYSGP
jgi:hypothetical protein